MATEILKASDRVPNMSRGELMRERKKGRIPAVYFGKGLDSVPVFVDIVEFERIFDAKGKIFEMEIGGKKKLVNTKTIQWDPLRKHIWHIDFYALKKGVETTVKVPVTLTGESVGVKEGGSVQQRQYTLEVTGTPMNIPEEIVIDVTDLNIGDNLHVSDVKIEGKYRIDTDPELTVATVVPPQKAEEEETAAEAEAEGGLTEGAGEEGEGGETPAAEGASGEEE